jgi:uncharacterized hydrophobic protein (TIGR00341 family)
MSLRIIEVVVPEARIQELHEILSDQKIEDIWTLSSPDGRAAARILMSARHTEAVTDLLSQRFAREEKFRIVLLPVEATLPAPDEKEEKKPVPETKPAKKKGPDRISREELYQKLSDRSRITTVYLVTVAVSTVVAAVGLVRGDVAIIIGAMVIAPLLGPNVGLSLASTLGDPELARRSLKAIGVGVLLVLTLSYLVGLFAPVDPDVRELRARTTVGFSDVLIALAAGIAGSLAYTTGLPSALIGVMVAVALLPPLVATGLLAGSGHNSLALGSLILVITNVTCLNLAGVATFLARRVRLRTWWETEKAKRSIRIAVSSWVVMLAILAVIILFYHPQ